MSWSTENKSAKIKVNPRVIGTTTGEVREIGGTRYRVVSFDGSTSESHLWNGRNPHQVSQANNRTNTGYFSKVNGFTGKR